MAHWLHGMKTWCHRQNWKYWMYCDAIRAELDYGHR